MLDDETSEDGVSGIVPFPVTERAKPLWTEVFTGAEWLVGVPGAVVAAFSAPPGGSRPGPTSRQSDWWPSVVFVSAASSAVSAGVS